MELQLSRKRKKKSNSAAGGLDAIGPASSAYAAPIPGATSSTAAIFGDLDPSKQTAPDADVQQIVGTQNDGYDAMDSGGARDELLATLTEYDNFDALIKKHGYDICDKMARDSQVRMGILQKTNSVISADYAVEAATEDNEQDVFIANFIADQFERIKGGIVGAIRELLKSGIQRGIGISELTLQPITHGEYSGMWGLKEIRNKNPRDFEFAVDGYNNLLELFTSTRTGTKKLLNKNKFIVYSHDPEFGRFYGQSDLRPAYKNWWSKDLLLKIQNIHFERMGMGLRVGKYPEGKAGFKNALQDILEDITTNTCVTLPEDMDIQFITETGNGPAKYQRAIDYHDRQIVVAILGQTLTSGEGVHGTNALGNIHRETMEDYVTAIRSALADAVIEEQIIKLLVDTNFGPQDLYPRFVWQPRKNKIAVQSVDDVDKLLKSRLLQADDYPRIRERLGLPWAEYDPENILELGGQSAPGLPAEFSRYDRAAGDPWIRIDTTENEYRFRMREPGDFEADSLRTKDIADGIYLVLGKLNGETSLSTQAIRFKKDNWTLADAKKWVRDHEGKHERPAHYESMPVSVLSRTAMFPCEERLGGVSYYEKQLKQRVMAETDLIDSISPIMKSLQTDTQSWVKKNIFTLPGNGADTKQLDNLVGRNGRGLRPSLMGDLKRTVADWINSEFAKRYIDALRETKTNPAGIPDASDYARLDVTPIEGTPIEAVAQIDKWKADGDWAKVKAWRARQLANLGGTHESMAKFWITDVIQDNVLAGVKNAILSAVSSGGGEARAMAAIKDIFDQYGADPKLTEPLRLEVIVRTNTTRAFADARRLAFTDPDVIEEFPAMMFSAVMDDRTSDICASLDGRIYRSDDPAWNSITPPLHYNCRSTIIPVPADEYKQNGDSKPPDLGMISTEFGGLK